MMTIRHRQLAIFATAGLVFSGFVGMTPLTLPNAAAQPTTQPSAGEAAAGQDNETVLAGQLLQPAAPRHIPVLVMLKDQPETPTPAAEKANLASQEELIERWSDEFGLNVDRNLGYLINGFSAQIPEENIGLLSLQPEVASVKRERIYLPSQSYANAAEGVTAAVSQHGIDGTGTVISIIDTGVNPRHEAMQLNDCASAKVASIGGEFTCKIPYGYNYADNNYEVWDTTSSQHGMHVAGIVAAHAPQGSTSTQKISGVAPNAQLFAMKVFSNDTNRPGAQDSDVIAAIEDSVKHGADLINLSLGSPNGVNDQSDGLYRAIDKAYQAGVVTVVAAGNDGKNFSLTGGQDNVTGYLDDATIGTPSVQGRAISVASVNNTHEIHPQAIYHVEGEELETKVIYGLGTGTIDETEREVVAVSYGDEANYVEDVAGKFVIALRGYNTFAQKLAAAAKHNAAGIIIVNDATGGNEIFGMSGVEGQTIFSATMGQSEGDALYDKANGGGNTSIHDLLSNSGRTKPVKIRFTRNNIAQESPDKLHPSRFSSWGTTPSLELKPKIAGIGANVLSTVNEKDYAVRSGTSMAAPNVTGVLALLTKGYGQRFTDLSKRELIDRIEAGLMNTALIPTHGQIPYAPRQVGAGLAQADQALNASVFATVAGRPYAELGEISQARTIDVKLENTSSEAVSFTIPTQKVLLETSQIEPKAKTATAITAISRETLTSETTSVTVPAHGNTTVTFTLNPNTESDHFIQGWIELQASANHPDLSVPYLGFVGDWNKELIVQKPGDIWSKSVVKATTELTSKFWNNEVALRVNDGKTWISPNGDGLYDVVGIRTLNMRNASVMSYSVLTPAGGEIELGVINDVRRVTGKMAAGATNPTALLNPGPTFDATMWDTQQRKRIDVPDGDYIYRTKARLADNYDWQTTDIEFGIDTVAPTIDDMVWDAEKSILTVKVADERSGVKDIAVTNLANQSEDTSKKGNGVYEVKVKNPERARAVSFTVIDNAGNSTTKSISVLPGRVFLLNADYYNNAKGYALGTNTRGIDKEGNLTLAGLASPNVASVRVNGETVDLNQGTFTKIIKLDPGEVSITAIGYDAAGNVIDQASIQSFYDPTPPVIEITDINLDGLNRIRPEADGSIRISGKITDDQGATSQHRAKALTATRDNVVFPLKEDGTFTINYKPQAGAKSTFIAATDTANNRTSQRYEISIPGNSNSLTGPTWDNTPCQGHFGICPVKGTANPDVNPERTQFTLRGTGKPGTQLVFIPRAGRSENGATAVVQGQDASHTPGALTATVGEDGHFAIALPVKRGESSFRYQVKGADGAIYFDTVATIWLDVDVPQISFDYPTLIAGTLFTNKDSVAFKGQVSDDGWGYTFGLNSLTPANVFYRAGHGPGSNLRNFDKMVNVEDGDNILIQVVDFFGNGIAGAIPVVVDKNAPQLSADLDGDNITLTQDREITISANDPNLASVEVYVNGEIYAHEEATVLGRVMSVQEALTDLEKITDGDVAGAVNRGKLAGNGAEISTRSPQAAVTGIDGGAAASGRKATVSATSFATHINTAKLQPGNYTISATGTDLAGNTTAYTRTFTIERNLMIDGPDTVELTVTPEELDQQANLLSQVEGHYSIACGVPGEIAAADGTLILAGDNTVTLIATDASGYQTMRRVGVKVTVKVPQQEPGAGSGAPDAANDPWINHGMGEANVSNAGTGAEKIQGGADANELSFSGASIGGLLVLGMALLGIGGVLLRGREGRYVS